MKKIFAFLFSAMFVLGAAAQENRSEPTLPPMPGYDARPSVRPERTAPPMLRARGMDIDDGYGVLSPYGVANLFGGTPAYDDYSAAMRYNQVSYYTLYPGVGVSTTGLIFMLTAAGTHKDFSFDFWEVGGATGLGLFLAGIPLIAVGASYSVKAKNRIARAVETYNEYTGATSYNDRAPELSLGVTSGGMGLVLKF